MVGAGGGERAGRGEAAACFFFLLLSPYLAGHDRLAARVVGQDLLGQGHQALDLVGGMCAWEVVEKRRGRREEGGRAENRPAKHRGKKMNSLSLSLSPFTHRAGGRRAAGSRRGSGRRRARSGRTAAGGGGRAYCVRERARRTGRREEIEWGRREGELMGPRVRRVCAPNRPARPLSARACQWTRHSRGGRGGRWPGRAPRPVAAAPPPLWPARRESGGRSIRPTTSPLFL